MPSVYGDLNSLTGESSSRSRTVMSLTGGGWSWVLAWDAPSSSSSSWSKTRREINFVLIWRLPAEQAQTNSWWMSENETENYLQGQTGLDLLDICSYLQPLQTRGSSMRSASRMRARLERGLLVSSLRNELECSKRTEWMVSTTANLFEFFQTVTIFIFHSENFRHGRFGLTIWQ